MVLVSILLVLALIIAFPIFKILLPKKQTFPKKSKNYEQQLKEEDDPNMFSVP